MFSGDTEPGHVMSHNSCKSPRSPNPLAHACLNIGKISAVFLTKIVNGHTDYQMSNDEIEALSNFERILF